MAQARCTTASAPAIAVRRVGIASTAPMSQRTHRRPGGVDRTGIRLATATTSAPEPSAARSTALPTFPLAPVTTMRMRTSCGLMDLRRVSRERAGQSTGHPAFEEGYHEAVTLGE